MVHAAIIYGYLETTLEEQAYIDETQTCRIEAPRVGRLVPYSVLCMFFYFCNEATYATTN